jgi:superfamily I DNA/RNA helicase
MSIPESRSQFEIFKFYLALYGFHSKGGSEELFLKGARTLKRYQEQRNGIVRDILTPLVESKQPGFNTLPNNLARALKGAPTDPDQVLALGKIFYGVCLFYKSKSNKVRDIEDKISREVLKTCVSACFDDQISLSMLLNSPSTRIKIPKRWIAAAAKEVEGASEYEVSLSEAKEVRKISEELRTIDIKLKSDISDEEKHTLLELKKVKLKKLEEASRNIKETSPALAIANSILETNPDHKTKVGQQRNLSQDQEDLVVSKGERVVEAASGTGKTKVVASKVAYTINELGVPPQKLMVVSPSKDTADNLRERVVKYSGEAGSGKFVGVSTETVSFSILKEIGVLKDKGLIRTNTIDLWIDQALDLVASGEGSASATDKPALRTLSEDSGDANDPRLIPLLIRVVRAIAKKALQEKSKELLSLISPSIKNYSDGKIVFLPKDSSVWSDKNFRASINQYIQTAQGKQDLSSSSPYEGFRRFASSSAKPKKMSVSNEWFNLGMDPMHNSAEKNTNQFKTYISEQKRKMKTPSQLWKERDTSMPISLGDLKKAIDRDMKIAIYGAYEFLKESQNAIDEDDFSSLACQALIDRPALLKEMNKTYSHIFVDEAQDLTEPEKMMFGLISGKVDPKTLKPKSTMTAQSYFKIGDSNQKIGKTASPVKVLSENFRSRSNIVEAANKLVGSGLPCAPNPDREGGVIFYSIFDKVRSPGARTVAQEIKEIVDVEGWSHDGGDNHKFGIATRSNKELPLYATELMLQNVKYSSKRDFFKETPIRAILSALGIKSPNPVTVQESVLSLHQHMRFNLDETFNERVLAGAGGRNLLLWLVREEDQGGLAGAESEYALMLREILEFEGDALDLINFVLKGVFNPEGKSLTDLRPRLNSAEEFQMLEVEIGGREVSSYEKAEFAQAGFDCIYRVSEFCGDRLEVLFEKIESLQKVSTMSSKERDRERVLLRICQEWKGLECRDLYLPMSPTCFPRIGQDVEVEEKLAYLAITRAQEKVSILCGEDTSPLVDKACILSREEFESQAKGEGLMRKSSQELQASDLMRWLEFNE